MPKGTPVPSWKIQQWTLFCIPTNYFCREEEIVRYWVLSQKGQQTKHWITSLERTWIQVCQIASLSLTLVRMVSAMQERPSWKHCLNLFYMWPACGKAKEWFSGWIRWETMCEAAARLLDLWDLGHFLARGGEKNIQSIVLVGAKTSLGLDGSWGLTFWKSAFESRFSYLSLPLARCQDRTGFCSVKCCRWNQKSLLGNSSIRLCLNSFIYQ